MLIPSNQYEPVQPNSSLSRRVNANSQLVRGVPEFEFKLIKKGEC